MKAKRRKLTAATLSAFLSLAGAAVGQTGGGSSGNQFTSTSGKKGHKGGKKGHKGGKKGHKGGKKSTRTTPPPK